jgi:hypothetical protein
MLSKCKGRITGWRTCLRIIPFVNLVLNRSTLKMDGLILFAFDDE